jgi:hypothetical protein
MIRSSFVFIAMAALVGTACNKKEDAGAAPGAVEAKPAEGKENRSRAGPTKLSKLGLLIEVPCEVSVGDAVMGEGHMLQGSGIGALQVEVAAQPQTLDDAKSDADMYSPKNLKTETLTDGWALTFENTGSAGTNYWVDVRRTIDGKSVKCTTTGSDAGQAAAVLAACKSLRK